MHHYHRNHLANNSTAELLQFPTDNYPSIPRTTDTSQVVDSHSYQTNIKIRFKFYELALLLYWPHGTMWTSWREVHANGEKSLTHVNEVRWGRHDLHSPNEGWPWFALSVPCYHKLRDDLIPARVRYLGRLPEADSHCKQVQPSPFLNPSSNPY